MPRCEADVVYEPEIAQEGEWSPGNWRSGAGIACFELPGSCLPDTEGGRRGLPLIGWRVTMRCLRESGPEAIPEADQGSGRATCLLDVHLVESEPAEVTLTPLSCPSYPASEAARVKTIPLCLGIVWNSIKKKSLDMSEVLWCSLGSSARLGGRLDGRGVRGRMDTCMCMLSLKRSQSC